MRIIRVPLSKSENWRGIEIVATSTPGDEVHVPRAESGSIDEVYIHISNTHTTTAVTVTIEFGGTDNPRDLMNEVIPPLTTIQVVKGRCIQGEDFSVAIFASITSKVNAWGWVNRIYQQ